MSKPDISDDDDDVWTAYLTEYEMPTAGDGEWSEVACGCMYAVGTGEGCVFVIPCDAHHCVHATEFAKEELNL